MMARVPASGSMIALSVKPLVSERELNEAIDAALEVLPQELASQALAVQAALASPGDWEAAKNTPAPNVPTE